MFLRLKPSRDILPKNILSTVFLCLFLTACNQENHPTSATSVQKQMADAKLKADQLAALKAEAAMAAMSLEELRKLASNSLREQRLYAPAGNNAVEYYLAVRKKMSEPDAITESALMDLTPYTVIAAEQAISRNDFSEASRLRDLIAAVDANAPALPRISHAIADGLKNTEALAAAETKREQEVLLAAQQAVLETEQKSMKPAAVEPEIKPLATTIQTSDTSAPTMVSMPVQSIPLTTASAPMPRSTIPAPAAKKAELIAIRTPDPSFPGDALNRGLSGAVEIEFIVQRSGEVSEVKIVSSSQRAFDRNVVTTVKRWRFAPIDEPMTVRRSFNFNNPS